MTEADAAGDADSWQGEDVEAAWTLPEALAAARRFWPALPASMGLPDRDWYRLDALFEDENAIAAWLDICSRSHAGTDRKMAAAFVMADYAALFAGVTGACRNFGRGSHKPCLGSNLQALLAFCSPKISATRSFWLRTVHSAAKPKPFLSQSIASNPLIVRRAVLNERKPPMRGIAVFTLK